LPKGGPTRYVVINVAHLNTVTVAKGKLEPINYWRIRVHASASLKKETVS
jgi:hypothetical protein